MTSLPSRLFSHLREIMSVFSEEELGELYKCCHSDFPALGQPSPSAPTTLKFSSMATQKQQASSPISFSEAASIAGRTHATSGKTPLDHITRGGPAKTETRGSKWHSFNASDIKAMLPNANSKVELPNLKVVHLSGFKLVTVVRDILDSKIVVYLRK